MEQDGSCRCVRSEEVAAAAAQGVAIGNQITGYERNSGELAPIEDYSGDEERVGLSKS